MAYKNIDIHKEVEPVTLTEAKAHLRVSGTENDSYITDLISQAREYIERISGNSISHHHYDWFFDAFPLNDNEKIELPLAPLDTIEYIKYYDNDNVLQTWDSANYTVDNFPQLGHVFPAINKSYPVARNYPNSVNIRFALGPIEAANDYAQSGSGSSIVLAAADTNIDDYYTGMVISIISGKGYGQWTRITDYVAATKTATVADGWSPSLDATSEYLILGKVPLPFVRAIMLLIGHWYENREDSLTGVVTTEIDHGVRNLIAPFKVFRGM